MRCVVTGASSGIGRRTALELARRGGEVCVVARRSGRLDQLVGEMPGDRHIAVVADVSDLDQIGAVRAAVEDRFGRCDLLVNNAGIPAREAFALGGPDTVRRVLETNLMGAVNCCWALLDLLERSDRPSVVNVASVAGRIPTPGNSAYVASKFALVGWTESVRPELAKRGVHATSVEPGFVATEGFPNRDIVEHRLLRHLITSDRTVANAILAAAENRKAQRVVPRAYYLLQVLQVLMPRLFRAVLPHIVTLDPLPADPLAMHPSDVSDGVT